MSSGFLIFRYQYHVCNFKMISIYFVKKTCLFLFLDTSIYSPNNLLLNLCTQGGGFFLSHSTLTMTSCEVSGKNTAVKYANKNFLHLHARLINTNFAILKYFVPYLRLVGCIFGKRPVGRMYEWNSFLCDTFLPIANMFFNQLFVSTLRSSLLWLHIFCTPVLCTNLNHIFPFLISWI